MKSLFSALGIVAILFTIGCSTNPVETEAYKKMASGLDSLKTAYSSLSTDVAGLGASLDQMKSYVAGLPTPDSTLMSLVSQYEGGITASQATLQKHQDMMNAQTEKMKNHATMKMEEIAADFDAMTTEYSNMMTELTGVKDMHMQMNQAFQTAVANIQNAAATTPSNKK